MNYLPPFLAYRCVREILVLDNRLRASVRQPGSFQSGAANFLLQRKGSNCSGLADMDTGWSRTRCGFMGATNTCYRSFSARIPILLCIGTMPGILFSTSLFRFGAPSCFAARGRRHQQIVGPRCKPINHSSIYPDLNSGICSCLADSRRKKILF